jgi:membrane dipeptidase
MVHYPIADLHCDLLEYLTGEPPRTAYQPDVRCSIPQLSAGGVSWQTMAIYVTSSPGSSKVAMRQYQVYKELTGRYPEFKTFSPEIKNDGISIALALENASGLCEEGEPLEIGLKRLAKIQQEVEHLFYISLTWNDENRFGGGNLSSVGLKQDGRSLLEFMSGRGIAVDLSHTSDALAYEIIDFIDKAALDLPLIASHSNFRRVRDVPRNLPDEIAKEIGRRKGIIGMNVIASFLGEDPEKSFVSHMEHALNLGLEKQICFGADFFYEGSIPVHCRKPSNAYFYPAYNDASTYQKILKLYEKELGLSTTTLQNIASGNFLEFFKGD